MNFLQNQKMMLDFNRLCDPNKTAAIYQKIKIFNKIIEICKKRRKNDLSAFLSILFSRIRTIDFIKIIESDDGFDTEKFGKIQRF
jgi:hypothetical protein